MNPDDKTFNPATIRGVVDKSIGLLERRCIRLNGRDRNWRGLFEGEIDEIIQSTSPTVFESRMNAVIARGGLSHVAWEAHQVLPIQVEKGERVIDDRVSRPMV